MQNRPSGFGNPWLQLGVSIVCVFVSELLLKRGASEVAAPDDAFSWTGINGLASPLVWWAIILIIASFITWLYVLRYVPLSLAYPLSRVVDILVPLGCWIFLGRTDFYIALVWDRPGDFGSRFGRTTDRKNGGAAVTCLALLFILISLVTFVAAQLILKRAMEFSATHGMRNSYFISRVAIGVVLMTVSFFLTLGLLQRFDLSYLYPFQGLSVIFITILAAIVLREKVSARLTIGALLITAGIVLVSMS